MTTPTERAFAEAEAQGLPRQIEDPVAIERLAAMIRNTATAAASTASLPPGGAAYGAASSEAAAKPVSVSDAPTPAGQRRRGSTSENEAARASTRAAS